MFHDISWNMGALVSSWIVGPLYGINICVFVLCIRVLLLKGLRGPNVALLITAIVQFAISTGHVITLLVQLIRGFISSAGTIDGPSIYFRDQATPEHLAQEFLYITNVCVLLLLFPHLHEPLGEKSFKSLIGDAILIWRLYIIWDRKIWLCAPFLSGILCIATGICGYTPLANLAQLNQVAGSVFQARVHDWLFATWALSIATQFGATLMIGYKIWISISWGVRGMRGSRLSVLWILVESGAAYSCTTIMLLGFSKTAVGAIFVASLGQISAIAPTLIIVRAGLKSTPYLTPSAKESINNVYDMAHRRTVVGDEDESRIIGEENVEVRVMKTTHVHLDGETSPRMFAFDRKPRT